MDRNPTDLRPDDGCRHLLPVRERWYVRYPLHIIPEYRQHCWRLCETIARNWQAGFYKTRQFTFPEQCDGLRKEFKDVIAALRAAGKPVPWTLPEDAFAEFDGREPKSIYTSSNAKIRYAFEFWRLRHDKPSGATRTASTTLGKLLKSTNRQARATANALRTRYATRARLLCGR